MLRSSPPDRDPLGGARALPVSFNSRGTPPGEDAVQAGARDTFNSRTGEIENQAQSASAYPDGVNGGPEDEGAIDFLAYVRQAEDQSLLYQNQANRKAWSQSYRAFHNEHYIGSKYTRPEWRGRSKLFVPKTRGAVKKDAA